MSLARHNIRVFYWATLIGSMSFLEPVITLFYLHRGLSPLGIFFSLTAFSAANLIAEVPTGAFADRYGPKASFMVGSAVMVLSRVLLFTVPAPWAIYVANSLWAVGWSFFSGADEALLYESLKESGEEGRMSAVLGRINSAGFLTMTFSFLIGPFLARNLTERQFLLLIGLEAICQAGKFLLITRVKDPAIFEHYRDNPYTHLKNAVTVVRTNPALFLLFMNATLVFIPTYVFQRWDSPFLTGAGLPAPYLGLMYAAGSLLCWFLSERIGALTRLAPRLKVVLWSGFAVLLSMVVAALFQHSLIMASLAFFLVRAGRTIRNPILGQMQNEHIPSGSRSTALSLLSVLDSLADVVVVPLMALLAGFGLPAIFTACAGVVAVGLLLPVREARSVEIAESGQTCP
jgi:MFS family permease